eukprot:s1758_g6.t1
MSPIRARRELASRLRAKSEANVRLLGDDPIFANVAQDLKAKQVKVLKDWCTELKAAATPDDMEPTVADLQKLCQYVRATFEVLTEVGCFSRNMAGTPLDPDMEQALQARREMEDVWANVQLGMEPKRAPVKEEHPDEDRRSKFHRGQSKGQRQGKGSSWDGWENYTGHRKWEDDTHTAVPDAAIQAVIRAMTKLALRHEEKLSRLRIDTSWMVFLDNQQEGAGHADQPSAFPGQRRY